MSPESEVAPDYRRVGLRLFLASLSTLIGAAIVGYLVVRFRASEWPPPGVPGPPWQLGLSTALLLLSSGTLDRAVRAARGGDQAALRRSLVLTAFLAATFLANQALANAELLGAVADRRMDLFTFTFFMLTGLHGLHVLGGLVPLALVLRRARRGGYGPADHAGVRLLATYWHYVDGVWLVMFVLLVI